MDAPHNQVFFPSTLNELFSAWTRFPDSVPYAGGTGLLRGQGKTVLSLPKNILSLENLEELRRISRTERYLEIGATVKLNEIINLGKIVPEALTKTLLGIGGPQVRNLATIGGNLCCPAHSMDAAAPLAALDARYELRTANQIRWISATRFSSFPGATALESRELLTRIRIPLEQWDSSIYKKFEAGDCDDEFGGVLIFVARNQKNILTDIRLIFAGDSVLRDKNSEALLAGKQLPLERKDAAHFAELWQTYLSGLGKPSPLLRAKLVNTIEMGILGLAD
ncbi:FAD-binding protein [Spirochaetia bacterium]|nr:FAD-binding protein [Spirochaetia bacterium]